MFTLSGWLSYLVLGRHEPNKQERLFWGDSLGRDVNIFILRTHLLVQSIYFSLLVCFYIPAMFKEQNVWGAVAYTVVSLAAFPLQYLLIYPTLLIDMILAGNTGILKNKSFIVEIVRAQKLERVVRLLVMLTKLKSAGKEGTQSQTHMQTGGSEMDDNRKLPYDPNDPKIKAEKQEISKIFDIYDPSGDSKCLV